MWGVCAIYYNKGCIHDMRFSVFEQIIFFLMRYPNGLNGKCSEGRVHPTWQGML